MKIDLYYDDHGWTFQIEPETEMEKCALDYLADRPKHQVTIRNTRLGLFVREAK